MAIILLFNFGALTLTMIFIRRVQKVLLEMLSLLLLLNAAESGQMLVRLVTAVVLSTAK